MGNLARIGTAFVIIHALLCSPTAAQVRFSRPDPVTIRIDQSRTFLISSSAGWDVWCVSGTIELQRSVQPDGTVWRPGETLDRDSEMACPGLGCDDLIIGILGEAETVFLRSDRKGRFGTITLVREGQPRPQVVVSDTSSRGTWGEPDSLGAPAAIRPPANFWSDFRKQGLSIKFPPSMQAPVEQASVDQPEESSVWGQ